MHRAEQADEFGRYDQTHGREASLHLYVDSCDRLRKSPNNKLNRAFNIFAALDIISQPSTDDILFIIKSQ